MMEDLAVARMCLSMLRIVLVSIVAATAVRQILLIILLCAVLECMLRVMEWPRLIFLRRRLFLAALLAIAIVLI